jgi:PE-PPE domain
MSNLLAVANAIAGMQYVHLGYGDLTMEQVQSAVLLGQSGQTDFYMIPTQVLPILQSLYDSSESGKEVADLLQPDLQVIINMGYGNLEHGLVADPGGVDGAVGVGFFDKVDPLAVEAALQLGQVQGIVDATDDYLSSQGDAPLPDSVTTLLDETSGYDFTSWLDGQFISGLTQLSTLPGMADLNPDVLFDGLPLISGTNFIDSVNEYITGLDSQLMASL